MIPRDGWDREKGTPFFPLKGVNLEGPFVVDLSCSSIPKIHCTIFKCVKKLESSFKAPPIFPTPVFIMLEMGPESYPFLVEFVGLLQIPPKEVLQLGTEPYGIHVSPWAKWLEYPL